MTNDITHAQSAGTLFTEQNLRDRFIEGKKPLTLITVRSKKADHEMYGSDQSKFLEKTEKYIQQVKQMIPLERFEFDEFLDKIGSLRSELATTQKEKSVYTMGVKRDGTLTTVISTPYYGKRALELLNNLEHSTTSFPEIAKKFDAPKHHAHNPYLSENNYHKYQMTHKSHDGKQIPLTRCYVAKGTYLPAQAKEGTFFPEKQCELSGGNVFYKIYFREYKEFLACSGVDDILSHEDYDQSFNKNQLLEIAKSFHLKGENKLSRAAFAATFGKLIRGKPDDGNIADKDSWCCIENPDEKGKAIGVGICHPKPNEVTEIIAEAKYEFSQYKQTKQDDQDKAFKHACNVIYLMAHAAPFMRGSAWSAEVAASALMRDLYQKKDISFVKSNLDFLAFGKTSDDFSEAVKTHLSIK